MIRTPTRWVSAASCSGADDALLRKLEAHARSYLHVASNGPGSGMGSTLLDGTTSAPPYLPDETPAPPTPTTDVATPSRTGCLMHQQYVAGWLRLHISAPYSSSLPEMALAALGRGQFGKTAPVGGTDPPLWRWPRLVNLLLRRWSNTPRPWVPRARSRYIFLVSSMLPVSAGSPDTPPRSCARSARSRRDLTFSWRARTLWPRLSARAQTQTGRS